jgi:hypothetical protein
MSYESNITLLPSRENGQIYATTGPGSTTTFDIWSDSLDLHSISAYLTSPIADQRIVTIEAPAKAVETPWAFIVRCETGTIEPGTEFHSVEDAVGARTVSGLRVIRILRSGLETDRLDPPHSALPILTGKTRKPPAVGDKLVG